MSGLPPKSGFSSAAGLVTDHLDIWTGAVVKKAAGGRGKGGKGGNGKIDFYGIRKLRELILELAVRGKLVAQDTNDEPASVLLEKVAQEKARLVKAKVIRKTKVPVPYDQVPKHDLPGSWCWTTLYDLGEIGPRNDLPDHLETAFVPMQCISEKYGAPVRYEARQWKEIKKGFTHFQDNDVVLAKITPCFQNGKSAVMHGLRNGFGAGTTELHVLRPIGDTTLPEYVLVFLKSPGFLLEGIPKMTGTAGQKRITRDYFAGKHFPLPPLPEQHRIVAKVDELMALCDQLEQQQTDSIDAHQTLVETLLGTLTRVESPEELSAAWSRIADHFDTLFTTEHSIDQLKQTILQLAVMGKLVRQDPDDEPASVLLERIAEEKARLVKAKIMRKSKVLVPFDQPQKYDLPHSWCWTTLHDLGEIGPRNDIPDHFETAFVPMQCISEKYGAPVRYEARPWKEIKNGFTHFQDNDVVLAKITPCFQNGKSAVMHDLKNGVGAGTTELHVFRPIGGTIVPEYVLLFLKSPGFLLEGVQKMTGTAGQKRITRDYFSGKHFPLPPLPEQHRIVAKVDQLMALCDALKSRIQEAQTIQTQLADAIVEQAVA